MICIYHLQLVVTIFLPHRIGKQVLPAHLALVPAALPALPVGAGLLVGQAGTTGDARSGSGVELRLGETVDMLSTAVCLP